MKEISLGGSFRRYVDASAYEDAQLYIIQGSVQSVTNHLI